jgi:hypothetical protein
VRLVLSLRTYCDDSGELFLDVVDEFCLLGKVRIGIIPMFCLLVLLGKVRIGNEVIFCLQEFLGKVRIGNELMFCLQVLLVLLSARQCAEVVWVRLRNEGLDCRECR